MFVKRSLEEERVTYNITCEKDKWKKCYEKYSSHDLIFAEHRISYKWSYTSCFDDSNILFLIFFSMEVSHNYVYQFKTALLSLSSV